MPSCMKDGLSDYVLFFRFENPAPLYLSVNIILKNCAVR